MRRFPKNAYVLVGTAAAFGLIGHNNHRNICNQSALPQKEKIIFSHTQLSVLPEVEFHRVVPAHKTIIFLHIPKTGGTNLNYIAAGLSFINPMHISKKFRAAYQQNKSLARVTYGWTGSFDEAKQQLISGSTQINYNFISGHFPFGLHELVPGAKYVALVRDPVQRSLSLTNFNYQRGIITNLEEAKLSLFDEIDNPQTRIIAGVKFMSGPCTEETLKQAKENIERHFLLVAPTEETETFIAILATIQKWGAIATVKSQVSGDKIFTALSKQNADELRTKHHFDDELYQWVKERWNRWKILNVKAYRKRENEQQVLCIGHEFAVTKTPFLLTVQDVMQYNEQVGDKCVSMKLRI